MADSFTRDSLATYEKGPQKQISDEAARNPKNFFRGAKPAEVASAAAVAAVAAGQVDATPGGAPQQRAAAANTDPLIDDSPVVDEDGTLGDPTDSGEGTSEDENSEDTSASAVDPGDETDPNADLTAATDEEAEEQPAPKKGSAAERIVEVLDLAEGYKEYGKMKDAQVAALTEEINRLRGGAPATAAPAAAPAAAAEEELVMPDISDEDVAFDNEKLRVKMQKYIGAVSAKAARDAVRQVTGADRAAQAMEKVEAKVSSFEKDHPDFDKVVRKNVVLAQNPLGPDAGQIIQESDHTAEMLYRFGKDPGLAIRVARMPPRQQVQFVTRMEDQIIAEKKAGKKPTPQGGAKPAQKKSITQAPPPPRAVAGGGRAAPRDPTDSNMSMDEFARQHRAGKQAAREANRKGRGLS